MYVCVCSGWLQDHQVEKLQSLGVSLAPERSSEDLVWDHRLTELLAYRREHGDCRCNTFPITLINP